jgi:hypothetical protein
VALLRLRIPSLQSPKKASGSLPIAAAFAGAFSGTEPKHEAVLDGVQSTLRLLDRVLRSALELRAEGCASRIADREQLFQPRRLCGRESGVDQLPIAPDPD